MASVYQYRVTCGPTGGSTASPYHHYVWDVTAPTSCPTGNSLHAFIENSVVIVNKVEEQTVKLKEEDIPTGGRIQVTTKVAEILGITGTTQTFDYTMPININLFSVTIPTNDSFMGDCFDVELAPNTIIGVITADGATGATGIYVSQTVVDNLEVGFFVTLFNGVKSCDCRRALSIDKVTKYVELETPLSTDFSASTPTYVRMTIRMGTDIVLGPGGIYKFGSEKQGSSYIPAHTVIRLNYINKTTTPKTLCIQGEYLY